MISENQEDTREIAEEAIDNLESRDNLILLHGELGAGKTNFSQSVLKYLGAEGPFTSPTFVIMKEYLVNFKNKQGTRFKKVYHLDCYRIDSAGLLDLGWNDIIKDKNSLILLEWPEKIEEALPKNYLKINFKVLGEKKRNINIKKFKNEN
jgi:tRNA threonylcarbamoyladenosine biosynthesis protein TsaE